MTANGMVEANGACARNIRFRQARVRKVQTGLELPLPLQHSLRPENEDRFVESVPEEVADGWCIPAG